jgi:hypothetical protein
MTVVNRPTVKPRDFAKTMEEIGAQLGAAQAKLARIGEDVLAMAPPDSKLARKYETAKRRKYDLEWALKDLIEAHAPKRTREVKLAIDEEERLASAVRSFESLCVDLRSLNRRPSDEEVDPAIGRQQYEARTSVYDDVRAVREAIEAAGVSNAVGRFPMAQLDRLEAETKKAAKAIAAARNKALDGLNKRTTLTAKDLRTVKAAAEALARLVGGDAELAVRLAAAVDRVKGEKSEFKANLALLAMIADLSTGSPDYATTRVGDYSPRARKEYRARKFDDWDMFASRSRQKGAIDKLNGLAERIAKAKLPDKVLEEALPSLFLEEIGVDPRTARDWNITPKSLRAAMTHEVFLPLRVFNETIEDIAAHDGAGKHEAKIRALVRDITRHVLEGDYREWRYQTPWSVKQLAALSADQKKSWMLGISIESEGPKKGLQLKTREEDGPELLWVTKIGGPSHGFDVGPNCLLPLLANGRSKAILVDDPRWPHNAAARSYLRALSYTNGKPLLYLEPMERDFPHCDEFRSRAEDAYIRFAQIKHALEKAKQMGVPLSVSTDDKELLEELGVKFKRQEVPFVLEPSGGIFEASDTLGLGHDCEQTKRLVTPPIERLVVAP